MHYEILGLLGTIVLVLCGIALTRKFPVLGIIAGILLIITGGWVINSGIEHQTGTLTVFTMNETENGTITTLSNMTGNVTGVLNSSIYNLTTIMAATPAIQTTSSSSQTSSFVYTQFAGMPLIPQNPFFGTLFILLGIVGIIWFGTMKE